MKIIKLNFDREENGQVKFNKKNLDTLTTYVIPIIEKNDGWGTKHVTYANFNKNPENLREDINAVVGDVKGTNVYAVVDKQGKPLGLLEYLEVFYNSKYCQNSTVLKDMLTSVNCSYWKHVFDLKIVDKDFTERNLDNVKYILTKRPVIKYIGVVVKPSLQGKKSGVSDALYKKMNQQAFLFGWTSSPLVLAKRRKLFKNTLFFPLQSKISTVEDLTAFVIACDSIFNENHRKSLGKLKFGVDTYKYFVDRNKKTTMGLAESLLKKGKIKEQDYKNIKYMLDYKKCQGVVISYN